jgi:membrane dipeptidase
MCRVPKGLEDVSTYPALFTALLASDSWSLEDLKKLAGLNFLRVMRTVEQVSSQAFNFVIIDFLCTFRTCLIA